MYDIVNGIIDHSYVSNYSGEQQYVYYICGALIVLFAVIFIDIIRDVFRSFIRG